MSSLWTPDGEQPVGGGTNRPDLSDVWDELTDEDRERARAMAAEVDEVRRQLSSVPAAVVVANHAMGLFELAAIHLGSQPANFGEARVAIDALGVLVEGMEGRLGEHEETLKDSLGQIRLAFVQLHSAAKTAMEESTDAPSAVADDSPADDTDDTADDE